MYLKCDNVYIKVLGKAKWNCHQPVFGSDHEYTHVLFKNAEILTLRHKTLYTSIENGTFPIAFTFTKLLNKL
jgi:hypothetical protein